ncbi:MAG: type II/IV secretion system ATPase subunit [Candidatus Methanoperedenaceae archaeon]|nr:type II/IV secretion system ATPase subunit [Candidatus Methanoperedenaceae archaeon]
MENIRDRVRRFLTEFTSPQEKDIQDFISYLAIDNPSLDRDSFRNSVLKSIEQRNTLKAYEKELLSLTRDSPFYAEIETILKEAKEGHDNLEDVEDELDNIKKILTSLTVTRNIEKPVEAEIPPVEKPEEITDGELEDIPGEIEEEEIPSVEGSLEALSTTPKKEEVQIPGGEKQKLSENADAFMRRLNLDDTKTLLKDHMTPEKQAVFELLEEKLMSDVETRIKKLKEMQTKVLEEEPTKTFFGKIKTFFTKETENIEAYDISLHGPLVTFEGLEGFNEIERYWVNEPYSFVVILFDPENNTHLYYAAEPVLTDFEELFLREIKERLKDVLLVETVQREEDKKKIITAKVIQLVRDYAIDITPLTLEKVLYYTRRDFIYFGKIDPLMHDNRIEDISSNGFDIPIYLYHKKYTNIPTNIYYKEKDLNSYVIRLAQRCGKHISVAEPMIDATMPDGSRIQMTLGTEVTSRGSTFTIRKFSEIPVTPIDMINWNTFSAEEMAYLWVCIENNKSLIFSGGTASGKTSSLNAVSLFIPPQAKIVTLEDTRELKLPHPNWIPGVTRASFTPDGRGGIDMYELLRAALRQRPEFLLVGEVRGKEALTLFQAMSTGHTTFSTMHADSVASAIHRLENPPISVPRTMIQALDIISIQAQTYVGGKRARRNMKIVEITDIDPTTKNIRTNDIFIWDALTDKFLRVGESKALNEIMLRRGWSLSQLKKELSNRQKIMEFMVNNKITEFHAISTIIHDYQSTPDKVITKLNITDN